MSHVHTEKIDIRFADIDAMGHVNNAVYLSYFEEARIHYFNRFVGDWNWKKNGIILARNEVDYKAPLLIDDEAYVDTWISRIGTRSFDMNYDTYRIVKGSREREQVAYGKAILVCFDHESGSTQSVPEKWKNLAEN